MTFTCVESSSCDAGEFRCDNDECIFQLWTCDLELDCEDGSDERGCGIQYSLLLCNVLTTVYKFNILTVL